LKSLRFFPDVTRERYRFVPVGCSRLIFFDGVLLIPAIIAAAGGDREERRRRNHSPAFKATVA
jgi:hypothetical protein